MGPDSVDSYLASLGTAKCDRLNSLEQAAGELIESAFLGEIPSDQIFDGKYRILQPLDHGGQGDIYLAERADGVYQQKLAIKFIAQNLDQPSMAKHFQHEMQVLADLNHPGVVPLIDGNITENGKPWLALEYIDGQHIDDYCNDQQLDQRTIVELLIKLSDTLAFVHSQGVSHKDLKPSNILVKSIGPSAHPMLIDFGIAASASSESHDSAYGTVNYCAPEQMAGGVADLRSDLYSLGIVAMELFRGRPFAESNDHHHWLKTAKLDSDLRHILKRCTASAADNRYQDASSLRADLDNWLRGMPIASRAQQPFYLLRKLVARNALATLCTLLVIASAILFGAKYTQDIRAQQQATLFQKNASDSLMNFMLEDLYENLARIGRVDVLASVADKGIEHLMQQSLGNDDFSGHLQAAKAFMNAGRVLDQLEQSSRAANLYQKAEQHLERLKVQPQQLASYRAQLGSLRVLQSQVLTLDGQQSQRETMLLEGVQAMRQLASDQPTTDLQALWEGQLELAYHYLEYDQPEQALPYIDETVALSRAQLAMGKDDPKWAFNLAQSEQLNSWYALDYAGLALSLAAARRALESATQAIALDAEDLKKQHNLRILYGQLAYLELEDADLESAAESIHAAIQLGEELSIKAPFNQEYRREHAVSFTTAGSIQQSLKREDAALSYFERGLEVSETLYRQDTGNLSAANDLAIDLLQVASIYRQREDGAKTERFAEHARELMRVVFKAEPGNKYYAKSLLVAHLYLGESEQTPELFEIVKNGNMIDEMVRGLLQEQGLASWLQESEGPDLLTDG